jgi:hypothetical protein
VWARILEPLATLRKEMGGVQVFPRYISGEDLFGLTEPAVVRVLESLPGMRIGLKVMRKLDNCRNSGIDKPL